MRSKSILGTLLVTSTLGLSLAGCRLDDRQLAAADTAWPATLAAPDQGPILDRYGPPPQRIPVGRLASYDDGWAWADRSYALDRAFYDTPPDYGFYYDNYEPWVWQTNDRWAMYGDPYADDAWRYYYYQPGAVRPYFIRDDRYGYGYDDAGRLVAMFDLLGRLLPQADLYRYEDPASRYYQRAYLMRQASLRAQPVVITREVWLAQAPIIQRTTNVWISAAQQQPDWVRYRERTGDRFVRAFDDERRRRAPSLTAAQAAPDRDQPRGFFGRPASQPPPQVARIEPDRRGRATSPQARGPDLREAKGRKDEAQRAIPADRGPVLARDEQRQARELDRKLKQTEQQHDQQRQVEDRAQKQQQAQQHQAEAQARQQQAQQRQAEAQAQKEQQDQQRQAEAQARQQQQAQQHQAEAQARQQQSQQRQAQAQARQQQQAQQHQAEAQARQQQSQQRQAQAQAQAKQQAQNQQADKEKQRGQKQEAQAPDQTPKDQGKGHGRKG